MNIEEEIKTFDDYELAFIGVYRINSLSDRIKDILIDEIKKRNLSKDNIRELIEINKKRKKGKSECHFCGSDRMFNYSEIEYDRHISEGIHSIFTESNRRIERKIDQSYCMICGSKKKDNWFERLKRLIIKN